MKRNVITLVVAMLFVVLAACSPVEQTTPPAVVSELMDVVADPIRAEATIPEITIDAADFSFTAPESIGAGWVRVTLKNSGAEPHHIQFLRLNDGVSMEQFQEALQQGEGPAMALVKHLGGVGAIAPTMSAQAILNLSAGEYVILCFISSPSDHMPHLAKGMLSSITVKSMDEASASEPTASLTVRLKDFSFGLPETISSGQAMIEVINDGPETHEFNLLLLADGKSVEDVLEFLNAPDGPPPFTPVGGINGLDVGFKGYIAFDFQPGRYVAICNIPSPKAEGHQHFSLGMIQEFNVK